MIDLHTHTTASDGRLTPDELVARAVAAGVTVLSVTDHDTMAGCAAAAAACAAAGVRFVPGIEATAVVDSADVHILGYFVDVQSPDLQTFLAGQRQRRAERVRQMIARLAALGVALDADAVLLPSSEDSSIAPGRPWIARALVAAGYAATTDEAFERWLVRGRPAFVARTGEPPPDVFARIHAAGGLASIAHPALVGHDDWLPGFAAAGMDALEAYHSDHDPGTTRRYLEIARRLGLAVSGGSDYHGDESHGPSEPGSVALPLEEFERLTRLKSGSH